MKHIIKNVAVATITLVLFSAPVVHAQAKKMDIVDTAVKAGNFTILAKALTAAGLVDALKSDGPFTVFAPTDEAFMRLPKGTIQDLLKPKNKEKLIEILKYHVVAGNVPGSTAVTIKEAEALNGQKLNIAFKNAALYLNDAKVIATDIKTSNGVIHVIDTVLIPETAKSDSLTLACEKILIGAVDVGVDLFNNGDKDACEKVYKLAVLSVASINPPSLTASDLKVLREALAKVEKSKDSKNNSWTLRKAIDSTMVSLFD